MTDQAVETVGKRGGEGEPPTGESFADLLDGAYGTQGNLEGTVVPGTVIAIENDMAVIDVGLKSEGRVALKEFSSAGETGGLNVGDQVEVFPRTDGKPDRRGGAEP